MRVRGGQGEMGIQKDIDIDWYYFWVEKEKKLGEMFFVRIMVWYLDFFVWIKVLLC